MVMGRHHLYLLLAIVCLSIMPVHVEAGAAWKVGPDLLFWASNLALWVDGVGEPPQLLADTPCPSK